MHIHECVMCTLNNFTLKCSDYPSTVHITRLAIVSCCWAALDQDTEDLQLTLISGERVSLHRPVQHIIALNTHLGALSARVPR